MLPKIVELFIDDAYYLLCEVSKNKKNPPNSHCCAKLNVNKSNILIFFVIVTIYAKDNILTWHNSELC